MAGLEFGSAEELVIEVIDATSFMGHATLTDVFREWEQWLQEGIDMEGE
jgi:hypothetical protein